MSDKKIIAQKAISKWRSDGTIQLLCSTKWHIMSKIHRRIRKSWVFQGERQFNAYTNARYHLQKIKYSAPADPWKPVYINPNSVEYIAHPCKIEWGIGRVKNGGWDAPESLQPIEEDRKFKGLRQRFVEGKAWPDTVYVEKVEERFDSGRSKNNYEGLEEYLNIRCQYVDNLFKSIKTEGYRPNFNAEHSVPQKDSRNNRKRSFSRLEPLAAIGRDGEIYLRDGFHRLTIAQILGIESIPVNILARHQEWQNVRDKIHKVEQQSNLSSDVRHHFDHPDLSDVGPKS